MKKYALFLFPLLISCASTLYVPVASINNVPLETLTKGRELYVQNCGSCHALYTPEKYNNAEWARNLEEMQPKAKISDSEKQLIYQYLVNAPAKK